ncbi:hypothetical protein GOB86_10850 [Acetobacter lambici]|uniref:Uncharacterized protein n=1 Tax=Acetobacter lambici TaxID=1332824 RepID=A0ABT1EYC6_9PROT|nr:hypothetical protein [Acetobacter lambici]MCP1241773.1 hypothetical protein [Acetobacter lambici]MCP1257898.1 hypothetical protein [Acetobacter lambici]NHO57545.1 hypothetical protein [Acetobacter lambici]
MPMLPISLPAVWDVPVAAGVPVLLGQSVGAGVSASASTTVATMLDSAILAQAERQWGIFTPDNRPVLTSGHVRALGVQSQCRIASAPQEDGSFLSYNKVRMPGLYEVEMLCDGSSMELGSASVLGDLLSTFGMPGLSGALQTRALFVAALDALVADLGLYHIVMPEAVYTNVNVTGYRIRREVRLGVSMLLAELSVQEVRLGATTTQAGTATPQGQVVRNGGHVQALASNMVVTGFQ